MKVLLHLIFFLNQFNESVYSYAFIMSKKVIQKIARCFEVFPHSVIQC
jgi:hypothetical protein